MVRRFQDRPVAADQLDRIVRLARKSPSAGFSQGQSFVVIDDGEARRDLLEAVGITDEAGVWGAPAFVVVCTSEAVYRERYMEPDKRLADGTPLGALPWPVPYWYVDAGASMMLLLLAAVDEGLSACFFGLGPDRWERLEQHLGIPAHVTPVGIVAVGHGAPDEPSPSLERGWKPAEEVVHLNRW